MKFRISMCMVSFLMTTLIASGSQFNRAPRPNALSYPGSTPQIVGSSDSALLAEIQKCVCEIRDSLQAVDCDAIPLTDQVAAITIDTPGYYCLASDVIQDITITATGVTLDLNNHRIQHVAIVSVDDVILRNGTIIDSPANGIDITDSAIIFVTNVVIENTAASALVIDRSRSIRITNVTIYNAVGTGIDFENVSAIQIEGVVIGFSGIGISESSSVGIIITDTIVYNCTGSGFLTISDASLRNCIAFSNGSNGFRVSTGSTILENCQAIQNVDAGIRAQDGARVQILSCAVETNAGNGFEFLTTCTVTCDQCIASENVANGFFRETDTFGLVRSCSANDNGGFGFDDQGALTSQVVYVNNIASNNNGLGTGQNYSAATTVAPFYSYLATDIANGVNYWTNVAMPTLP